MTFFFSQSISQITSECNFKLKPQTINYWQKNYFFLVQFFPPDIFIFFFLFEINIAFANAMSVAGKLLMPSLTHRNSFLSLKWDCFDPPLLTELDLSQFEKQTKFRHGRVGATPWNPRLLFSGRINVSGAPSRGMTCNCLESWSNRNSGSRRRLRNFKFKPNAMIRRVEIRDN